MLRTGAMFKQLRVLLAARCNNNNTDGRDSRGRPRQARAERLPEHQAAGGGARPLCASPKGRRENQTHDLYIRPGPCAEIKLLRREVFNLPLAPSEETPLRRRQWGGHVGAFSWVCFPVLRPRPGAPSWLSKANYSFLFAFGGGWWCC